MLDIENYLSILQLIFHHSIYFQDSLRDAGCLLRLQHLIVHSDRSVRLAAIAAVGNLALNTANQRVMQVNIEAKK